MSEGFDALGAAPLPLFTKLPDSAGKGYSRKPVCSFANRYALGVGLSAFMRPGGRGGQHTM